MSRRGGRKKKGKERWGGWKEGRGEGRGEGEGEQGRISYGKRQERCPGGPGE